MFVRGQLHDPFNWLHDHGVASLISGLLSVGVVAALVIVAPIAPANAAEPLTTVSASGPAATADCSTLATGSACILNYSDYPGQTLVTIPNSVDMVTIILSGASGGGGGKDNQGAAGSGGTVVATIPLTGQRAFDVWLGQDGTGADHATTGWSGGGRGGVSNATDGAAGGGSSGLAWATVGHDGPLAVAGGGGGGGAPVYHSPNGGLGGSGGNPPMNGGRGTSGGVWGSGGKGGGSGTANGDDGHGGRDPIIFAGGGGGGGGYPHGGSGGQQGEIQVRETAGSAGGGGGGESYVAKSLTSPLFASGHVGGGRLAIYPGNPQRYQCASTWNARPIQVPKDVVAYAFIAVGGAGTHGHNEAPEGTGAIDAGVLNVRGISTLNYWVGCDGYSHHGAGFGKPGHGGDGNEGGNDGGNGGGATMVTDATTGTPLVAAGGGGGNGGDAPGSNCTNWPGNPCGGQGGNSGGKAGSALPADGQQGGDHGGDGGCANCEGGRHPNHDGGNGTSPDSNFIDTGGGGGGGSGYPAGGHGGHHDTLSPGGGGGSGGSYLSPQRVSDGSISASGIRGNGFLMLMPVVQPTADLKVTATATGAAASYARGPFVVHIQCALHGTSTLDQTTSMKPGETMTFSGLPVGSNCTATETDAAGASTPASPVSVTLGSKGASLTLINVFAATMVDVSLASVITAAAGGANPGVSFSLGQLAIHASCTLAGQSIDLPTPASGGDIAYTGDQTWAKGGVTSSIAGLPVGSLCTFVEAEGSGATEIRYSTDGSAPTGNGAQITLASGTNDVSVTNDYKLGSLDVTKAADGVSVPPPGAVYAGTVTCQFQGRPVTLAAPATFSVAVGQTSAVPNLPIGADCTATETDKGDAAAVHYAPGQTVPIASSPTAAITVTNTFDDGSLLVSLSAGGSAAQWANARPTIHVTCAVGETTVLDETFTTDTPSGGSRAFSTDGEAQCSATETDAAGATNVAYGSSQSADTSPSPVTVTTANDGTATLTIANTFVAAPVVVATTTAGAGRAFGAPTTVVVDGCTFNGEPIEIGPGQTSETFVFPAAGGTAAIAALPTNAACTVTQTDGGGASATVVTVDNGDPHTSGAPDSSRVTVNQPNNGSPTRVEFANTIDVGALGVSVDVTGAAAWAANVPFEVRVTCSFLGAPLSALGPGGSVVLTYDPDGTIVVNPASRALGALPLGANCFAAETQPGGATTVGYAPAAPGSGAQEHSGSVSVQLGGSPIVITNTFAATSLSVSSTLAGNDAASHADDVFYYDFGCTFNGLPVGPPPDVPNRSSVFTLTGGSTHVIAELPTGSSCAVNEFYDHHATQVSPSAEQSVTLGVDPASLAFENSFDVASLEIAENITGDGAATYGLDQIFTAIVYCQWPHDEGDVTLPDNGVVTLNAANGFSGTIKAPYGSTCGVLQNRGTATTMTIPPAILVGLGDVHALTVTSEYRVGSVTVSKHIRGDLPADATYEFTMRCTWTDGSQAPLSVPLNDHAPGDFQLRSGQSRVLTVLSGSWCVLTETDAGAAAATTFDVHGTHSSVRGRSVGLFVDSGLMISADVTNIAAPPHNRPDGLADTGSDPRTAGYLALALVLLGSALILGRRRRRRT